MQYKNPGIIKFKAKIQGEPDSGAHIYFPFDAEEKFGVKGRIPVNATFDGIPYKGSMVKYGTPEHLLIIIKSIREQIKKEVGDEVNVTVELDDKPREVEIPKDLQEAFKKNPAIGECFNKLAFTHQKEYARYITEAKKPETRVRRLEKTIQMLKDKQTIS